MHYNAYIHISTILYSVASTHGHTYWDLNLMFFIDMFMRLNSKPNIGTGKNKNKPTPNQAQTSSKQKTQGASIQETKSIINTADGKGKQKQSIYSQQKSTGSLKVHISTKSKQKQHRSYTEEKWMKKGHNDKQGDKSKMAGCKGKKES